MIPAPAPAWPGRAATAVLALAPLALMAWTWGTWADPQVDFGRELYAAWRIAEGDHLYRDLAWFNGPLSAYWNAAWFELLGPGIRTLALVNLGLVYVAAALLAALVRRWSGPAAGRAAVLVFLCTFAFGQNVMIGNYNFITPYSHEVVHGLIASLASLAALQRLGRGGGAAWAAAAGACLGLAFLTKAEVFLAAAAAAGLRLGLHLAAPPDRGRRGRIATLFCAGAVLPVAVACAALAQALPAGTAARAVAGSWPYVGDAEVRSLLFYLRLLGIDHPGRNAGLMLVHAAGWVAALGGAAVLARRVPAGRAEGLVHRVLALAAGAGVTAATLAFVSWRDLPRAYPLLVAGIAAGAVLRWRRERPAAAADQLAFAVLAGALLMKMLLRVRLEHYGFALALPATALLVAAAFDALPRAVARAGGAGRLMRAAVLGGIVVLAGARMENTQRWIEYKRHVVARGRDPLRAGGRGPVLSALLEDLRERMRPEDTLIVLPEGVMVNHLLRRRNPTPFVNFMPPELIFWGERPVVYALENDPPDVVVLMHKDTLDDYGKDWFGSPGFGETILNWVRGRYGVAETYGARPFSEPFRFGAQVLVPFDR